MTIMSIPPPSATIHYDDDGGGGHGAGRSTTSTPPPPLPQLANPPRGGVGGAPPPEISSITLVNNKHGAIGTPPPPKGSNSKNGTSDITTTTTTVPSNWSNQGQGQGQGDRSMVVALRWLEAIQAATECLRERQQQQRGPGNSRYMPLTPWSTKLPATIEHSLHYLMGLEQILLPLESQWDDDHHDLPGSGGSSRASSATTLLQDPPKFVPYLHRHHHQQQQQQANNSSSNNNNNKKKGHHTGQTSVSVNAAGSASSGSTTSDHQNSSPTSVFVVETPAQYQGGIGVGVGDNSNGWIITTTTNTTAAAEKNNKNIRKQNKKERSATNRFGLFEDSDDDDDDADDEDVDVNVVGDLEEDNNNNDNDSSVMATKSDGAITGQTIISSVCGGGTIGGGGGSSSIASLASLLDDDNNVAAATATYTATATTTTNSGGGNNNDDCVYSPGCDDDLQEAGDVPTLNRIVHFPNPANHLGMRRLMIRIVTAQSELFSYQAYQYRKKQNWTEAAKNCHASLCKIHQGLLLADTAISRCLSSSTSSSSAAQSSYSSCQPLMEDASIVEIAVKSLTMERDSFVQKALQAKHNLIRKLEAMYVGRIKARERLGENWYSNRPRSQHFDHNARREQTENALVEVQMALDTLSQWDTNSLLASADHLKLRLNTAGQQIRTASVPPRNNRRRPADISDRVDKFLYPDPSLYGWNFTGSYIESGGGGRKIEFFEKQNMLLDWHYTTANIQLSWNLLSRSHQGNTTAIFQSDGPLHSQVFLEIVKSHQPWEVVKQYSNAAAAAAKNDYWTY